uniref:hypothetical protein n=1 Tax=Xylanibacter rodentium TaxID=2736289 RepID=UPI0025953D98
SREALTARSGGPLCFYYKALSKRKERNLLIISASYFTRKIAFFGLLAEKRDFVTGDEVICKDN